MKEFFIAYILELPITFIVVFMLIGFLKIWNSKVEPRIKKFVWNWFDKQSKKQQVVFFEK